MRHTRGIGPLIDIKAVHVAAYIEQMGKAKAPQTVKQHLAGVKAMFDYLITGGVLSSSPASAVRGSGTRPKKAKRPSSWPMMRALIRSI